MIGTLNPGERGRRDSRWRRQYYRRAEDRHHHPETLCEPPRLGCTHRDGLGPGRNT
jgi:hypothetical protein